MKKVLLSLVFSMVAIFAFAQHQVTIRVDLGALEPSSGGVHVAGNFQAAAGFGSDWNPSATAMTDVGDGIYEVTVTLPNGIYEFKFLNGNNWGMDESVPAIAGINPAEGNNNRFFVVNGADLVLDPVVYSQAAPAGKSLFRVTCDLTLSSISPDGVHIAGDFQTQTGAPANWDPAFNRLFDILPGDNFDRFVGMFYLEEGTYNYKFLNGNNWGTDESVPSDCAVDNNRQISIIGEQHQQVQFCFGTCNTTCVVIPTFSLTINVDMNFNCLFDPAAGDYVDIAGPFNGWAGGEAFAMQDLDGDGVYSITLPEVNQGTFTYKARIIKSGSPNWEGSPNIDISITDNTNAPVRCFGFATPGACAPLPPPTTVTFRVDFVDAVIAPASNIYVMGDFTTPAWQGGAIELQPMGAGFPGKYQVVINDFCPANFNFKFVNGAVNVPANEEFQNVTSDPPCALPNGIGGFNRFFTRTDGNPVTIQYVYNTCNELTISIDKIDDKLVTLFPNPAQDAMFVQVDEQVGMYQLQMFDITGKLVFAGDQFTGTSTIARGQLQAGIYTLRIVDALGRVAHKKAILN